MAKYSVVLQRAAAHATQAMGSITAPGSGMRRIKLYDVSFGSEATPADTAVLWTLGRCSTAGTAGTNPTPSPLDVADGACVAVAGQAHSASPTPGVVLMSQALNTFDPGWLPFLLTQVRDREAHPDVRLVALQTYAFIANKQEAIDASTILSTEPTSADGGQKERFAALLPIVAAANTCDVDVTCWLGKLRDNDPLVIQKAAVMIGRLARGNQQAIDALVPLIGHAKAEVRIAALGALDRIAERGAPAAVTKIDELAEREDGQRVWSQVAAEALRVQNRLRARSGS